METVAYLYGHPPYALMYLKKNANGGKFVGVDLHLFRPTLKISENKTYNATVYHRKNFPYKIKINRKIYLIY